MFCVDANLHRAAKRKSIKALQLIMESPSTLVQHCERCGKFNLYCLYDEATSSSLALNLYEEFQKDCILIHTFGISDDMHVRWKSIQIKLSEHRGNRCKTRCSLCDKFFMEVCATNLNNQ